MLSKLLSVAILLCTPLAAFGSALEAEVKAAFILNFAKFIEWPAGHPLVSQSSFNFCFIGSDRFKKEIRNIIEPRRVKGLPAEVRIQSFMDSLEGCGLVFMRDLDPSQLAYVMKSLRGSNALTVGESDQFMRAGGMIRFYASHGKIRFEINPPAAEKENLAISSKLLNLARITPKKGEPDR